MVVRFLYTKFNGFPYGAWIASIIYMMVAVEVSASYDTISMKYLGFGTVPVFWIVIGIMHLLRKRLGVGLPED